MYQAQILKYFFMRKELLQRVAGNMRSPKRQTRMGPPQCCKQFRDSSETTMLRHSCYQVRH